MTCRDRPLVAFFGMATALFVFATAGSDIIARVTTGNQNPWVAATEHMSYAFTQPIGTAMLLLPYLVLASLSGRLALRRDFGKGLALFLLGALVLGFMYFSGYQDSQIYMQRRKWTAATLSVGLLPFKSIPVLLVCTGLYWFLKRRPNATEA